MSKVKFGYDIKKDAWSWVEIAKDKNLWGLNWENEVAHIPEDLLAEILKIDFLEAQNLVEDYIKKNPKREYKELVIKEQINSLESVWETVEEKYFETLAKLTDKSIFSEEFGCFWTTGFMCPYNEEENWFMVSIWHSAPFSITTICHEIFHLQFLHYYKNYLIGKGLSEEQIGDIKEAITFLLNEPEFEEIILTEDNGYPKHQELRKKLKEFWPKSCDFMELLDGAIEIIKE